MGGLRFLDLPSGGVRGLVTDVLELRFNGSLKRTLSATHCVRSLAEVPF